MMEGMLFSMKGAQDFDLSDGDSDDSWECVTREATIIPDQHGESLGNMDPLEISEDSSIEFFCISDVSSEISSDDSSTEISDDSSTEIRSDFSECSFYDGISNSLKPLDIFSYLLNENNKSQRVRKNVFREDMDEAEKKLDATKKLGRKLNRKSKRKVKRSIIDGDTTGADADIDTHVDTDTAEEFEKYFVFEKKHEDIITHRLSRPSEYDHQLLRCMLQLIIVTIYATNIFLVFSVVFYLIVPYDPTFSSTDIMLPFGDPTTQETLLETISKEVDYSRDTCAAIDLYPTTPTIGQKITNLQRSHLMNMSYLLPHRVKSGFNIIRTKQIPKLQNSSLTKSRENLSTIPNVDFLIRSRHIENIQLYSKKHNARNNTFLLNFLANQEYGSNVRLSLYDKQVWIPTSNLASKTLPSVKTSSVLPNYKNVLTTTPFILSSASSKFASVNEKVSSGVISFIKPNLYHTTATQKAIRISEKKKKSSTFNRLGEGKQGDSWKSLIQPTPPVTKSLKGKNTLRVRPWWDVVSAVVRVLRPASARKNKLNWSPMEGFKSKGICRVSKTCKRRHRKMRQCESSAGTAMPILAWPSSDAETKGSDGPVSSFSTTSGEEHVYVRNTGKSNRLRPVEFHQIDHEKQSERVRLNAVKPESNSWLKSWWGKGDWCVPPAELKAKSWWKSPSYCNNIDASRCPVRKWYQQNSLCLQSAQCPVPKWYQKNGLCLQSAQCPVPKWYQKNGLCFQPAQCPVPKWYQKNGLCLQPAQCPVPKWYQKNGLCLQPAQCPVPKWYQKNDISVVKSKEEQGEEKLRKICFGKICSEEELYLIKFVFGELDLYDLYSSLSPSLMELFPSLFDDEEFNEFFRGESVGETIDEIFDEMFETH